MACGSVAVSKATIAKMLFSPADLAAILAKILNVDANMVRSYTSSWSDFREAQFSDGLGLYYDLTQQTNSNGQVETVLLVSGQDKAAAAAALESLNPKLERALIVGTQSAILRKLQQLGKLSNIQQKPNGVTAKIEISI